MLRYVVRMYLKEIFTGSTYWIILGVLLWSEYFAASQFKGELALVEMLQFIAIPVYIFLVSTVFFTEDKVLTFELVMFRDWSTVAVGRLLSLFLSLTPFTVATVLIVGHYHAGTFMVPISVAVLLYSTTIILSTVIGGGSKLYVLSMGLLFMLPFSSLVLIQNQASLGNPVHGAMGYLTYLFAPVYGSYAVSSRILLVDSNLANWIVFGLSVFLGIGYPFIFKRREVHPGN
ncbi:hypothetical protein [Thermococcus sp.]|uniref:hypothetical protein n=1 Tax=Thermococcus sp. TaxID=35749 RepID=UPI00261146B9|nr:hypothetical protein [Thermococcus sp.]